MKVIITSHDCNEGDDGEDDDNNNDKINDVEDDDDNNDDERTKSNDLYSLVWLFG